MKLVVLSTESLQKELLTQGFRDGVQIEWQSEIKIIEDADGYIDLLFSHTTERIDKLKQLSTGPGGQPTTIIVDAVNTTLDQLPAGFIRFNGWNSFLKNPLLEVAGAAADKEKTENIFSCFNKKIEWVPDIPGFITPRVICMIINEAYFTLEEKVSTKEEIDTAMKLGTNYPYGPFEWSAIIGLKNVFHLLTILAQTNSRYTPSALLQKEAQL